MKTYIHILAFSFVLASTCVASEPIKFTGASWDNLAIPLGITPFYLNIDSPIKVKSVAIEMDLYIKGKFVRTISSGGMSTLNGRKPLKANCAIYFDSSKDEKNVKGTMVAQWEGLMDSTGWFDIPSSEFPIKKGNGSSALISKLESVGRFPVFCIAVDTSGPGENKSYTSFEKADDIVKNNPRSSIIIGYLKLE